MSYFDSHMQQPAQPKQMPDEMRHALGGIKADPVSFLGQRGYKVPDGMTDPRQITQHLLQSGQIGGGRLQQVMRMIGAPVGR